VASYELLDGTRNYVLTGSVVRGTRCFIVDEYQDTALLDPIIPARNSLYEFGTGVPKAYARAYNVELYTPTQCKVTVTYDNDGSTRGPQLPDDLDPGYKDINVTYTRDTEKIPAFYLFYDVTETEVGGLPVASYKERWEPYDFTADAYYATAEVTVNLAYMNAGVQRAISDQVNVIHKFPDSLLWMFVGATTSRQQEEQWQITYRWVRDPGQPAGFTNPIISPEFTVLSDDTKQFVTYPIDAAPNLVPAGSVIVPTVARAPFEKWRVVPAQEPGERPSISVMPAKAFRTIVPNGYQTLPGNPIP
jgi:hypothetical protein